MAEDQHDDNEEFTTPHLPERYQNVVRAKRHRRMQRRILLAAAGILAILIVAFLFSGIAGDFVSGMRNPLPALPSPAHSPSVTPAAGSIQANISEEYSRGTGLAGPLPPGAISLERAVDAVRTDYPAAEFSILSANLTTQGGKSLYVFRIRPAGNTGAPEVTAYINAATGTAYSPGEESAVISRSVAQLRSRIAIPGVTPDRVTLSYTTTPGHAKFWNFTLIGDGFVLGTGTLDADTGRVMAWEKTIFGSGRQHEPAVTAEQAIGTADQYIIDNNGGLLPLNMSLARYDPIPVPGGTVAGTYTLVYERTYQDYITDIDGFVVIIDAITGEVIGYSHAWTTPDHAFAAAVTPDVVRREATFAVLQKAKELYPDQVDGLRIISANIRWKNDLPYGSVPRPGSIPLGWKVVFDDNVIRTNASAAPGVAWLDVQSGNFLSFEYQH